jgi:hypothetical protein
MVLRIYQQVSSLISDNDVLLNRTDLDPPIDNRK